MPGLPSPLVLAALALTTTSDDPTVHLLLSLHGIVRPDPVTHANQVLASVRPQLHSHGGDVTLVRVEDGTAFVRLEGLQIQSAGQGLRIENAEHVEVSGCEIRSC